MLGVLKHPLEVKIVEDNSLLGIPGPVLIASAAIVGAALAAAVAVWRMRVQLAHDREMKNREHRRNTLDEAIEVANETFRAVAEMTSRVRQAPALHGEHLAIFADQKSSPAAKEEAQSEIEKIGRSCLEAIKKARELDIEMTFQTVRINLRFGDDEISSDYDSLCESYSRQIDIVEENVDKIFSDPKNAELTKAEDVAAERFADLMVACEEWLAQG